MLKRRQIVKMTKKTLALTRSKAAGALPMSAKHRKRLLELKKQKEAEVNRTKGAA
jgi:hypothetical protein